MKIENTMAGRPRLRFYKDFETSDNHKATLHQDNEHKGRCWFIRSKIKIAPDKKHIQYITENIKSITEKYLKENTKRYLVSVDYNREEKSIENFNKKYKYTNITYDIIFIAKGTLDEIYELMTPMVTQIDNAIQKIIHIS